MRNPGYTAAVHKYGPFEVNEYVSEADYKMVDFDPNDLDTAFSRNPSTIAFFGHILGKAKRQSANFKTRRDAVKAKVSKEARDRMIREKIKPTEAAIEAEMRVNKEFLEVSFAENHAIEIEAAIEALYWAARGRRNDMEYFADKMRNEMNTKAYSLRERAEKLTSSMTPRAQ